jgi:hypothetical protein
LTAEPGADPETVDGNLRKLLFGVELMGMVQFFLWRVSSRILWLVILGFDHWRLIGFRSFLVLIFSFQRAVRGSSFIGLRNLNLFEG